MKRREFLQALGIGTATLATGASVSPHGATVEAMEVEVDPILADFAYTVRRLMQDMNQRPGWILVPQETLNKLEDELAPQVRFMATDIAKAGYYNITILGLPVIAIQKAPKS